MINMASEKFRQQLKKEAEQWQTEGLIDTSVFQQLAQRYQFHSLEIDSQNRFTLVLFALGGILLGWGAITLVAANWQGWSRLVRVGLLLSLFITVNVLGFWGWSASQRKWQSLGKALLLLGALILGANLGLMSQMFHQSGEVYELYLIWGGGVLAMAYSLEFTWLAIFAIGLVGIGYWLGLPRLFSSTETVDYSQLIQYVPLVATGLYLPLAYLCRSKWVWLWGVVAVVSSFEMTLWRELSFTTSDWVTGGGVALAIAIPPLLLWGPPLYPPQWGRQGRDLKTQFQSVNRRLCVLFLASVCYWFSFHQVWVNFSLNRDIASQITTSGAGWVQALIFTSLTVYSWWRLGKDAHVYWQLDVTSTGIAIVSLLMGLVASVSAGGFTFPENAWLPTVVYNIILFSIAIALIRKSLNQGIRLKFWVGLILLSLQIFSRMIEYQSLLIFKSIILFLCGLVIVFAGLWFERYLHQG